MPHRDYFRMLARKRREQELEEDGEAMTEAQRRRRDQEAADDAHSQRLIDEAYERDH